HGGPPQGGAGNFGPPSRDGRTSVRQHQAMDESGRVPDARPGKSARRIQPDGARLQFAASAQHSRHEQDDGGRRRLTEAQIALFRGERASWRSSRAFPRGYRRDFMPKNEKSADPHAQLSRPSTPVEFSHGLQEIRNSDFAAKSERFLRDAPHAAL